jgi:hypothetical protein
VWRLVTIDEARVFLVVTTADICFKQVKKIEVVNCHRRLLNWLCDGGPLDVIVECCAFLTFLTHHGDLGKARVRDEVDCDRV